MLSNKNGAWHRPNELQMILVYHGLVLSVALLSSTTRFKDAPRGFSYDNIHTYTLCITFKLHYLDA